MGVGTIFAQVGIASNVSVLLPLLSIFRPWGPIGSGLLIASYFNGLCSRAQVLRWIAFLILGQGIESYFTALTAAFMNYAVFSVTILFYFGIVNLKHCAAIALVLLISWPTTYAIRNENRVLGGVSVSSSMGAFDRLRFDLQVGSADGLGSGVDVGQPGPAEIIRYGVVPRFIDSNRPDLSTGERINEYLGGNSVTAFTFLPVTTLYFLEGPLFLAIFYGGWGVVLVFLMRGGRVISPMRLSIFSLIVVGPLGWFTTYPDSSIGLLQGLVSLLPIAWAVKQCREPMGGSTGRRMPPRSGGHPNSTMPITIPHAYS